MDIRFRAFSLQYALYQDCWPIIGSIRNKFEFKWWFNWKIGCPNSKGFDDKWMILSVRLVVDEQKTAIYTWCTQCATLNVQHCPQCAAIFWGICVLPRVDACPQCATVKKNFNSKMTKRNGNGLNMVFKMIKFTSNAVFYHLYSKHSTTYIKTLVWISLTH